LELGFTHNLGEPICPQKRDLTIKYKRNKAVTLIELLVSLAVITLLVAIMIPVLSKGRRNARAVRTMNNQRQIVVAVTSFASDNNGRYPESVATIGVREQHWNWQEPTMLTSYRRRSPRMHRSMSAYLRSYIADASIMFCPNAPKKYKYLQKAWDAGDDWDNPETPTVQDPLMGTYCFYWNYIGFLDERKAAFRGPWGLSGGHGSCKILVSDYFGYGHWRNKLVYNNHKAFGSCEKFKYASVTPGTWVSSDFWSRPADNGNVGLDTLELELHAGYMDGHVERYGPSEVVPMKVSKTSDGSVPYPSELGPGVFYLPRNALY